MAQKTVTAQANAQIDTAQKKFGTASGLFDGTGDYLVVTDNADFTFGTGNFTIDFWVRFNSVSAFQSFYWHSSAADNFLHISWNTNNRLYIQYIASGVWKVDYYIPFTPSVNTWYHIELSKAGTAEADWHTFIDGTEGSKSVVTNVFDVSLSDIAADIAIGKQVGSSGDLNGWIDEFRVLKGEAAHTSNFTPPTSAYSGGGNTVLLLHMDGTDTSTTFTDSSAAVESTATYTALSVVVTVPSITATYISLLSATFSPVSILLTIPSTTASYVYEQSASFSPISILLTVPSISSSYVYALSSSFLPLSLIFNIPIQSPYYLLGNVDSIYTPLSALITVPSITSTYRQRFTRESLNTNSFNKEELQTNSFTKEGLATNSYTKEPLNI